MQRGSEMGEAHEIVLRQIERGFEFFECNPDCFTVSVRVGHVGFVAALSGFFWIGARFDAQACRLGRSFG